MSDESEQQLTFTVKSSNDAKYAITITANSTVQQLKEKLSTSDFADIPTERQRLIYSGRVLKDHETLSSYKIKDGHTIHLVKGAESNNRQNPANQGGSTPVAGAGTASNVPSNIAAGTGAHNPLAQLTGARYAGFHQLPGADMFGADGGMGAPPDPDQLLRLLENPNFAQQMNEAMNNPDVINMMRNNPMLRNNPMAQQMFDNPEMRRMMMNPDFIRMQMNMQRSMGGGGLGGAAAFPAPGATDTTESNTTSENTQQNQQAPPNPFAMFGGAQGAGSGANPFAALFGGNPGAAQGQTPSGTPPVPTAGQGTPAHGQTPGSNPQAQANPFASLFGGMGGAQGGSDPIQQMAQQMMQNPEMMRSAMNMMQGMQGGAGADAEGGAAANPFGGMNPFAAMGGMGGMGGFGAPQQQQDSRPPEEQYATQLQQLNAMGFYEFERNVRALRMSGGSVEGAVEVLLSGSI
ncbi:hypothetical protein AUEXF2481DRAFT_29931 [Aureobasidium subglaciale EXF-2481]|uniref:Ubiquitin-like domain-containing protein n=1 Tax=Aureobasidium subglaciale (strain EXF-2481) TaxID=1043005 RepID=A0A074YGP3_AURSE|nr:uncharacterized protein AUEXF2481DRAFT_29931 [Aureobasidium subglaciale EXF-2481]KAI5196841.1 hypothetical protein E4T38_08314 [Aureobasidium subglaciale]KAI5215584.1 hypothetical protein E4T40_08283 [Aureobasidium subglaciale]KAI5218808.1 hypothetical protein E4T41_08198 [Aureobasidium subglaciale]KAI5256479.1 hypothetical protein E4T46_08174 [Aureobasidium subglaciale]KEQ95214.1 hypothetical protein AUEXF2481DRAFT_29931 [Aureobasidium subglaciale EXF-2481]